MLLLVQEAVTSTVALEAGSFPRYLFYLLHLKIIFHILFFISCASLQHVLSTCTYVIIALSVNTKIL